MKHIRMLKALLLVGLSATFTGCYKDEVAEADLTTNAFDQDYSGPALLELTSTSTTVLFNVGVPVDTVLQFNFNVRTDLFPGSVAYALDGVPVNGEEQYEGDTQIPSDQSAFVWHRHVVDGQNYCIDVSIEVQGTNTKSYRFCATADL
ncbi:MAG: hypothetical protein IPJ76_00470 [Flavobacteriales bacterium]|nr:MAG: hypothetical protein IPJ76_00470 [Flavobacteriales bacterium]